MPPSPQKQPLTKGLNTWLEREQQRFQDLLSKSVPASVVSVEANCSIVTVKVEVQGFTYPKIRCPVGTPEWDRLPIQVGDLGVMLSADFYMGGMSGIGGGTASLNQMANLSNGIWYPIGNSKFKNSPNKNARVLYGPDGSILTNRDSVDAGGEGQSANGVVVKVDGKGNVVIYGAKSVSTDVHGYGSRTTWLGGTSWRIDNYTTGATVTTVNNPINPPEIPSP